MNVKLVLDTCTMRNPDFVNWLCNRKSGDVLIPSVAYMELYRQTVNNNKSVEGLKKLIKNCNIKILPFDKQNAEIAAEYMARNIEVCPTCNKLDWTDTMIYACVGNPPTIFVTENITDFPTDKGDYIKTPAEIIRTF